MRRRDHNSNEWRDVSTTYYTVVRWRNLRRARRTEPDKGHPVVVVGRLYVDEWTDRDGMLRKSPKIDPTSVHLISATRPYCAGAVARHSPRTGHLGRCAADDPATERLQANDDDSVRR
ncbi:single-stranded DNA-binding protein [Pseudonocardia sp. MCCB 268]|nr:single-stranded DNA-binding protein [Pseudonocardia cytotoxica]